MKFSKELKIGSFAVIILIVSFFMINYLRGEDIFNREIELMSRYDNVEGLVPSAPVYIKGYKAGEVTDVEYDSDNEDFLVTCSVSRDFRIPADSRMTIYSVDIMGGKGIKIELGVSHDSATDGGMLVPSFEAGLIDGLSSGLSPILSKVTNTLDSLELTVSGINRMLSSENQNSISSALAHLDRTMASVSKLSDSLEGRSAQLEAFIDNLSLLSEKIVSLAENADGAVSGFSSVAQQLDESDLKGTISSFKSLLEDINDPEGTVGKLLTEDSVYHSIDSLLSDIDELVKKIQENPKKYIKISVF